jgi:hypothetical protein
LISDHQGRNLLTAKGVHAVSSLAIKHIIFSLLLKKLNICPFRINIMSGFPDDLEESENALILQDPPKVMTHQDKLDLIVI